MLSITLICFPVITSAFLRITLIFFKVITSALLRITLICFPVITSTNLLGLTTLMKIRIEF